jgi:RecJ-like exonuclease
MSELVTCPKCEGRGTIKVYPTDVGSENPGVLEKIGMRIGENIDKLAYLFEEKPYWRKTVYKTCPVCRGFGMVRKPD